MERKNLFMTVFHKMAGKVSLFFVIAFLILTALPSVVHAWELAKEDSTNEIKIYTRKVEGSNFREYKAVMRIKASLSSLVALVDDISACPLWIHTCSEGWLLKRVSPRESYTYTINAAPWPVSDRDAIVLNTISQISPKGPVRIDILGVPDYVPEKKNLVRVKMIKGHWLFTPLGEGITEVLYQVHNDPGGSLPSWLVNSVVVSQPYNTMLNMRKLVNEKKYKDAKFSFIRE